MRHDVPLTSAESSPFTKDVDVTEAEQTSADSSNQQIEKMTSFRQQQPKSHTCVTHLEVDPIKGFNSPDLAVVQL
jgi:hypothetical protein